MKDSDELLKIIQNEPCTLSKIYDKSILSKSTVRGRLYELCKKQYVKKLYGKFNITMQGLAELEKTKIISYNYTIFNTTTKTYTSIYTETLQQAEMLAKTIYGTNYKVDSID